MSIPINIPVCISWKEEENDINHFVIVSIDHGMIQLKPIEDNTYSVFWTQIAAIDSIGLRSECGCKE